MEKLLNKEVIHEKFGVGTIVEVINDKRIMVKFDSIQEIKKFRFPDAFEDFMKFKDGLLQEDSMELLEKNKKEELIEKEKLRVEHEKIYAEHRKEQLEMQRIMRKKPTVVKKAKK